MSLSSKLFICVQKQDIPGVICELNDPNTKVDTGGAERIFCYYQTPLELAVEKDSDEIVKLLVNAGANVNVSHGSAAWTPLHTAASRGRCDMMRMLIAGGANIEAQDIHGATPVFKAWGDGVELLLAEGANVEAVSPGGLTPLMKAASVGAMRVVEILLAHHAFVDAEDNRGFTALFHAVYAGNVNIVETLIAHEADVNAKDNQGLTPLMIIAGSYREHGSTSRVFMAKMLLEKGADIFAEADDGRTAVTFAVIGSWHYLEKFLRLEMDRRKFTAFAMSSHDRLGSNSHASKLHKEMLRKI